MTQETTRYQVERTPARYAVMLNARAKGWSGSLHHAVQRFVSPKDLFLTDDFRQAQRTVDRILSARYDAVFAGGGDGTLMYLINAFEERARQGAIAREELPTIGVLRLGTGNALASYLGADHVLRDLRALRSGAPLTVHTVHMVEGGGHEGVFPFAGFGWDADILNDYDLVKEMVRDTSLEATIAGPLGYGAAIVTRSIPRAVVKPPLRVRITNLSERAMQINYEGEVLREFAADEVVFEGDVKICGASSVPFWGFNVRMFPRATARPGFFQLRAFHGPLSEVVFRLRDLWRGRFPESSMFDMHASHVRVEILGEPTPYQVSGDVAGLEREIEWKIAPYPAKLAVPLH